MCIRDRVLILTLLGPFHGAIAVPSVMRCRRRCHGHQCARATVATPGEWACGGSNGPNIFQMLLVHVAATHILEHLTMVFFINNQKEYKDFSHLPKIFLILCLVIKLGIEITFLTKDVL